MLIIITNAVPVAAGNFQIEGTKDTELAATRVATFDQPWARVAGLLVGPN